MAPSFSGAELLCDFGRRHHEKQFSEIILNLDQWFRRICHLKKKFTDRQRTKTDYNS